MGAMRGGTRYLKELAFRRGFNPPTTPPSEESVEYELVCAAYEGREPELADGVLRRYWRRLDVVMARAAMARRMTRRARLSLHCRPLVRSRAPRARRVAGRTRARAPGRSSSGDDDPSNRRPVARPRRAPWPALAGGRP